MRNEAPEQGRRPFDGEALYRTHVRSLYGFIYSKVGNREAAEDLTSDVFLRALAHIDPSREEHSIIAWLYRVARNVVNDYWRVGKSAHVIALDEVRNLRDSSVAPDIARQDQAARKANELLNMLPQNYHDVLYYRLIEGLSISETAAIMATTTANVKVMQHRALKRAAEIRESE
ncbi:MAG: sigma-70 family polymerase sigma factor [Chloroflexi bacterium]|jgi:RNA polymerase sigma factor (sigma-70 family)|nr:sigma-70 family polymerase sigma factor [Chloroflexota bacterium]